MAVATSTCIDRLEETKEYRIIPAGLMRHVNATSTLSDGSKNLWFALWELCALETGRQRLLTAGFLAQRLGKSVDTIRRHVSQLREQGYLMVAERFDNSGRQLPSMFQVSAPKHVVAQLLNGTPDRKRKQSVDVEAKSRKSPDENQHNVNQVSENPNSVDVGSHTVDVGSKSPSLVDVTSTGNSGLARPQSIKSKLEQMIDRARERSQLTSNERSEQTRSDVRLQRERALYERTESRPKNEIGLKNGLEGEGGQPCSSGVGKFAHQEITPKEQNNKRTGTAESEEGGLRFWVYRQIKERNIFRGDPWRYADEIAVSIEKGSLKKFTLTKALNIALKLIREGRWTAPRFVV